MSNKRLHAFFAFLSVVILLITLAIACGGSDEAEMKGKLKQKINTEKFSLTVTSVASRSRVGGEYLNEKAPSGAIFVTVDFNYKNISKEPISSFQVPEVKLIDPNNVSYDQAIGATGYYATQKNLNKKIASDLNPGISQRDASVFEVSKENWSKKGWKLLITADKNIEIPIK